MAKFKPGKSGNPSGKPRGALNQTTRTAQELLDGEAQALTRKAVELAQDGNVVALRLCLERLIPPRKDRPVSIELPPMKEAGDAVKVSSAIIQAVATGDLTPSEAEALARLVEVHRRTLELEEIDRRLTALEDRAGHGKR
jgi:hypothetical protein